MSEAGFSRILAFDCSGGACSAAVMIDGRIHAERFSRMERGHAEALMPEIQAALEAADLLPGEIEVLATTVGPGSFTGLRIGLAAARGLALALDIPTVAVTSFEAYLYGLSVSGQEQYVVAIDSRRGPIFVQRFETSRQPIGETLAEEPDTLLSRLPQERLIVTGDAAARLKEFDAAGRLLPAGPDRITASMVAKAASALGGPGIGRMPVAPLYLRPPDVTFPSKERT